MSKPPLEATGYRFQRIPVAFCLGLKRPKLEADYCFPSAAEGKNELSCTPSALIGYTRTGLLYIALPKVLLSDGFSPSEMFLESADEQDYEGWNFNSGNYLFTTDTK